MIRLALVGVGGYGWVLAGWIRKMRKKAGCRLIAAADTRLEDYPERVTELNEAGLDLYDDALEMFEALKDRCDAVYIATGISSHAPLACAAMRAGLHVHLEKPTAATVQEVDRIIAASEETGRMCQVGFQAVHGSDIRFLKDRIVAGKLGRIEKLVCKACWPRNLSYYQRNEWAGKLKMGDNWVLDGPAMNALIHQVNNMLLLASDRQRQFAHPVRVRAEMYAAGPIEAHDTAAIDIRTADGQQILFLGTHVGEKYFGPFIDITGSAGSATWQMRKDLTIIPDDGNQEHCEYSGDEHANMVANLADAIRAEDPSLLRCSVAASRETILALNGAYESTGQVWRIPREHTDLVDADTTKQRTIVPGLNEVIHKAAEQAVLPSDLPEPPAWARATEAFETDPYDEFPRRFRCGQG